MKLLGYDIFGNVGRAFAPLIGTTRLLFALRHLMVAGDDTGPGGGGDPQPPDPKPYQPPDPGGPAPPPPPPPPQYPGGWSGTTPTSQAFVGEDEFILGQDGQIYQRQREGFRTVGWRTVGNVSDINSAAAVAGISGPVLDQEIRQQQQRQSTTDWNLKDSGFNGLTNEQLQQKVNTGQNQQSMNDLAWNAAASGIGDLTNYQAQQQNKTTGNQVTAQDYAWKQAASGWDPGRTNQQGEQDLQGQKDAYGWGETTYGLTTQQAQHNLENKQRDLGTQQATFNLGQEAQRQQNEAFKSNQTRYEQTQGAASRDTSGFGWAAMNPATATRLVGQ